MLREILNQASRALIFDPLGVLYPGIIFYDRMSLEKWLDCHGENTRFRAIYRPQIDESDFDGMRRESEYFCYIGRVLEHVEMFFDELDTFARSEDEPAELYALLNYGRKHYVSVRGTVRRPQVKVPRDWVTETTRFSIFQTVDPLDCGVLQRWTGIPADEFPKLQKFEYWEWNEGKTIKKRLKNPYIGGNKEKKEYPLLA